jgi:hypothetical protein
MILQHLVSEQGFGAVTIPASFRAIRNAGGLVDRLNTPAVNNFPPTPGKSVVGTY